MPDERLAPGRQVVREMFGEPFLAGMQAAIDAGGFGAAGMEIAISHAFTDVWARPGLERKTRSLLTMAMLIALRTPAELKNHVRAALTNGVTTVELEEMLMQAIPYCGLPAAGIASQAVAEVLKERGLLGSLTIRERGLVD